MPASGNDVATTPSLRSTRIMHDGLLPSSRRRSAVPPRRISSAPNLRSPPSLGSTSPSLGESNSSASTSFSRSSDSARWRPNQTLELHTPITPLAPIHHHEGRERPSRSATEPLPTHQPSQQQQPTLESATRTLEEVHRLIRELERRDRRRGVRGLWVTVQAFFGYGPAGSVARRDMMSLLGKMLFGAGQIGATIALLCIAARETSPINNTINEWQACRRPLGVWSAIWCLRVVLGCIMAIWGYRRKNARPIEHAEPTDEEPTDEVASHVADYANERRSTTNRRRDSRLRRAENEANRYMSTVRFTRITTLLSLFSLAWFVTAHVLIYTSVHTCRISAPHLWWLTFGIICIGYLVIIEVIFVAFIVFILGPLIFVFLNLILICMGRHPLGHPNTINPEVGKMPQKAVDSIPLVLYIPAPVPKESTTVGDASQDLSASHAQESSNAPISPLIAPEAARLHSYPPVTERQTASPSTPTITTSRRSRRLFTFRRVRLKKSATGGGRTEKELGSASRGQGHLYEDKWERGEYPFVKLEGNRAVCAICLCDFEEPRRVRYSIDSRPAEDLDNLERGLNTGPIDPQKDEGLRLTAAGEGAQPLRLLACAHVFHKSCLDPWLTEVSGRCPVCQRRVEVEDPEPQRRQGGQLHERR